VLLGGSSTVYSGQNDVNGPYQGYDSVIRDTYFNRIRRVVYCKTYCQSVHFKDIFVGPGAGSNLANGAAFEFDGTGGQNSGHHIEGTRCEATGYPYCFKFLTSSNNSIIDTDVEDVSGTTVGVISFDAASQYNMVVLNNGSSITPANQVSDASNTATILSSASNGTSIISPSGTTQTNSLNVNVGNATIQATSPATGGANFSSPSARWIGNYWTGAASAQDIWTLSNNLAAGSNPASTLTLGASGSSGTHNLLFGSGVGASFNGGSSISSTGALTVGSGLGANFNGSIFENNNTLYVRTTSSATSGANFSSPVLNWLGTCWNGASSTNAQWQWNDVLGAGANPTDTFTLVHTGCSGAATISLPVQLASTLATGTAPLSITSTTPVANLTTVPTTYNAAGTQQTATHLVQDTCTVGTNCGVTLTGSAAYTNATSYTCTCEDDSAIVACRVNQTAGNGFTITGTNADVIRYICVGN